MIKLKILLFVLILTNGAKSQSYEFILLDSISKSPIQDVYIQKKINGIMSIIGFSDKYGIIKFIPTKDSIKLKLTHISYHTKEFSLNNLKESGIDTVYLIPKNSVLSNVVIENLKINKTKTFGYYKRGKKQNLIAPANQYVFGTKVKIDTTIKKFIIQSLYCDFVNPDLVENRKSECKVGIIFHFRKISTFGPTLEEVIDPIIIDYENIKQNFKLEIPYSGIIDNSSGAIFIGIELQGIKCIEKSTKYRNYDVINLESSENLNWLYQYKQNSWKQYDNSLFSGKLGISIKIAYHE